jgi:hypothetical protein
MAGKLVTGLSAGAGSFIGLVVGAGIAQAVAKRSATTYETQTATLVLGSMSGMVLGAFSGAALAAESEQSLSSTGTAGLPAGVGAWQDWLDPNGIVPVPAGFRWAKSNKAWPGSSSVPVLVTGMVGRHTKVSLVYQVEGSLMRYAILKDRSWAPFVFEWQAVHETIVPMHAKGPPPKPPMIVPMRARGAGSINAQLMPRA